MNEAVTWTLEVADQATPALKSAAAASQQLTDTVARTDAQLGKLDVAAGKIGSSAMKLAGGLDLIAPGAGAAARGLGDLADVAEVGAGALGLSATALGVLGAALAIGAGAWYAYTSSQEEAAAQAEAQEQATRRQIDALNDLAVAQRDADLVIAQATGAMSPGQAWAQNAVSRYRAGVEGQAEELRRAIVTAEQETFDNLAARGTLTPAALASANNDIEAARAAYAAFNEDVARTVETLELAGEKRDEDAAAALREAEAAKAAAEAARREAEAKRARDAAERDLLRAVNDFASAWSTVEDAVASASEDMAALGPALSAEIAEAAQAREEAARAEMMAQAQQAAGYATGGPSAIVSGIGQAGPWGAIIAAVIEIVGHLDELGDTFNDFTIDLNNSIAALPDTLGDNIGRWLESGTQSAIDLVPNLLSGIAENLDDILVGIVGGLGDAVGDIIGAVVSEIPTALVTELIPALVDPSMWLEAGEALFEGFISSITGIGSGKSTGATIADLLTAGIYTKAGGYAGGTTYVPEDGMYQLHRGEVVTNRGQVASRQGQGAGRARMSAAGGRLVLELDPADLSDALDLAARRGYSMGGA